MADASCSGPSPFKRLVDHQGRDTSHHQDRHVNQQSAYNHGSFRSAAQPGQAQEGFEAFLNGGQPSAGPAMPPQLHMNESAARLSAHAAALRHAPTSDFLSSGHPHAAAAPRGPEMGAHAMASPNAGSWAADFARFSSQSQPHQAPQQPALSQRAPLQQQHFGQAPSQFNFQAAFAQPSFGGPGMAAQQHQHQQQPAGFDQELSQWMANHGAGAGMEQVDAAMEQMARELELNDAALGAGADAEQTTQQAGVEEQAIDAAQSQARQEAQRHFTDLETPEIGNLSLQPNHIQPSDPILEAHPAQEQDTHMEPDQQPPADTTPAPPSRSAVSEAAERLLESVEGEAGEKWKNSTFLSLMRDFRDGRKDVVGDEIRQTDGGEGNGGAQSVPAEG